VHLNGCSLRQVMAARCPSPASSHRREFVLVVGRHTTVLVFRQPQKSSTSRGAIERPLRFDVIGGPQLCHNRAGELRRGQNLIISESWPTQLPARKRSARRPGVGVLHDNARRLVEKRLWRVVSASLPGIKTNVFAQMSSLMFGLMVLGRQHGGVDCTRNGPRDSGTQAISRARRPSNILAAMSPGL